MERLGDIMDWKSRAEAAVGSDDMVSVNRAGLIGIFEGLKFALDLAADSDPGREKFADVLAAIDVAIAGIRDRPSLPRGV